MNGFRLTPGEPFEPSAKAWNRAQEAADVVFGRTTMTGIPPTNQFGGQTAAQGRLTSALTPCDNALTGATKFTFARYVTDSSIDPQTDPVTMMEEVDDADPPVIVETDGVNRSPLEASAGGHVVCVKINGEWVPVLVFDQCSE